MEQVNGGCIGLICVLGVVAGGICIAVGVGEAIKGKNIKIPSHRL